MAVYDPRKHGVRGQGRRLQNRVIDRKERSSRGGGALTGFKMRGRFKPPAAYKDKKTGTIIPPRDARVRLVPGRYRGFDGSDLPFHEYVEHFAARVNRGTICPKIYEENKELDLTSSGKCVACHERDEGARDISWRRMSAFLLMWLDWFYLVPAVDRDGKKITYKRDSKFHKAGDQIYDRILASTIDKRTARNEGYDKVFGKLMHWSMGNNHLNTLSAKMVDVERECHCGGDITTAMYECRKCGHEVFDLTEDGQCDLSDKELVTATSEPFKCPECGKKELLLSVDVCSECEDPDPLSIWEVDLWVRREGADTSSIVIISKHKYCELDERVHELIPAKDLLHRVFKPDTIAWQAKTLKVDNPWPEEEKEKDTRRHVQDYEKDGVGDGGEGSVDDEIPF